MTRGSAVRLLVLAGIWGASFLLIKLGLEGLTPIQLTLGRLVLGAGVLAVVLGVRRVPWPRERSLWGHFVVMAVMANIVPFTLFGWGEQRITSGLAGVLNGTTPLFTLAVATAVLPAERLSAVRIAGFGVGLLGVVLVVGPWNLSTAGSPAGAAACLLAAALYGVAFVYSRRFIAARGTPPLALAAGQLAVATLLLAAFAPFVANDPVELTTRVVVGVGLLGAVGTGLAYLLFYRLVTDAGATTASIVTYLIPVVAVVLGAVLLDEPVTWNVPVGAAVVVAGVLVAEGRMPGIGPRPRSPAGEVPAERPGIDAPIAEPS